MKKLLLSVLAVFGISMFTPMMAMAAGEHRGVNHAGFRERVWGYSIVDRHWGRGISFDHYWHHHHRHHHHWY